MSSFILRLEQQQQIGIETNNAFIPSHSFLENHSLFQTKGRKVYTSFQTRTVQKPSPFGVAHTYNYGLYKGVPPVTTVKIHKCEMTPEICVNAYFMLDWLSAKTWVQSRQKRKM